jgi:hypothetical protein
MPKSKTHFEQIPVKAVKQIVAPGGAKTETAAPGNLIVERVPKKAEPYSMRPRARRTTH